MPIPTRLGRGAVVGVVAAATTLALTATATAAPAATGPSTTTAPYLVGTAAGVSFTSLLSAGDSVGGQTFAGTPDGIGAYDNGDGTFTMLVNHEFGPTAGVVRAHGGTGSFVSKLVVDKATLAVRSLTDLDTSLVLGAGGSPNLARLCSADLPAAGAFFNSSSGKGYDGHIFMNGEENGAAGRAFGHVVETGVGYELPAIGLAGWENLAANPATGDETVVVGQSDGGTQNVYVYSGTKQTTGTPVEKAGLTNGTRASIKVPSMAAENSVDPMALRSPVDFTLTTGADGTTFKRPEDGAWDTKNPNVYYFATTAAYTEHSRIWKATFTDASQPELGGKLEVVLEGPSTEVTYGPHMMDNLTVDADGMITVLEDVGNQTYVGGGYRVDPSTGAYTKIFSFDPEQFTPGKPGFITQDEESSGVVPAPFLGAGKYLIDAQVHAPAADPAVVELGQVLVMDTVAVPTPQPTFASLFRQLLTLLLQKIFPQGVPPFLAGLIG